MEPTARILFHGPTGCGKTSLARAIANYAGVAFCEISASALVSGVSGSPEETIRKLFSAAYTRAPSIWFIDEIDAMTSKTGALDKVTEARIVKQLMACMDEPHGPIKSVDHDADSESSDSRPGHVLFIGATKIIDALHPALRQWFDREIAIPVPVEKTRHDILSALTRNIKVEVDLAKVAGCTPGYVGGDLVALVKGARKAVVDRTIDGRIDQCYDELIAGVRHKNCKTYRQPFSDQELENLCITMDDFMAPELLKYGHQSELVVQNLFNYARTRSPCILFFDELDVMTLSSEDERRWPDFRHVGKLHFSNIVFAKRALKQLGDVKGDLGGVFVIGATNSAQAGIHFSLIKDQFDKILYVPLPSPEERGEILKNLAQNRPIDAEFQWR